MPEESTLPISDYDQLPFGALQTRIRSLDEDQLTQLIEYERDHADRVLVLEALEHRRSELRDGAEPTSGDPNALKPELADPPTTGSAGGPAPNPPINPPAHGNPTNPSQPRD